MANNVFFSGKKGLPDLFRDTPPRVLEKAFLCVVKSLKKTEEYKNFAKQLGTPKYLEVHFCDDKEMRGFQKKFRKLDRTTDVLSFPSLEAPENSERNFLGSIVISLPAVERNAKRYKLKMKQELLNVYVHGILHLFSFDHVKVSPRKKARMEKIQADLQKKLNVLL